MTPEEADSAYLLLSKVSVAFGFVMLILSVFGLLGPLLVFIKRGVFGNTPGKDGKRGMGPAGRGGGEGQGERGKGEGKNRARGGGSGGRKQHKRKDSDGERRDTPEEAQAKLETMGSGGGRGWGGPEEREDGKPVWRRRVNIRRLTRIQQVCTPSGGATNNAAPPGVAMPSYASVHRHWADIAPAARARIDRSTMCSCVT